MKRLAYLIIPAMLLVITVIGGCEKPEEGTNSSERRIAKIQFISSPDFCNDYMIVAGEGVNQEIYKPQNLQKEYEIDGLQISVTFETVSDTTYNCGFAGYVPIVNILIIDKI
ncbi:MAG: hypothetical protein LBG15_14625 [Dysgonamonadaceae bacterium]|jgi:hypothetical protein|nr:hypothetical protein [Dysgonamonadaceae bacterium]